MSTVLLVLTGCLWSTTDDTYAREVVRPCGTPDGDRCLSGEVLRVGVCSRSPYLVCHQVLVHQMRPGLQQITVVAPNKLADRDERIKFTVGAPTDEPNRRLNIDGQWSETWPEPFHIDTLLAP